MGCPKVPNPVAGLQQQLRVGYAAGSHLHAYQSYAFVYSFANGNAATHQQAIDRLVADGVPLFDQLVAAGATPRLVVSTEEQDSGIQAYAIDLEVQTKDGPIRLSGKQGTDPEAYAAGAAAIAQATGIPQPQVEAGHGACYHLTFVLTGLDAEATTLSGHAFALQVLRERVEAGEQADWFDARRPASETVADVEHAHALIADDIERVRAEQAAILATVALANHAHTDGVIEALNDELAATKADLDEWRATHRQPTPEDFGVVWQMPDPRVVQTAIKDQLGVVGGALEVVRGVSTGNLPATLDGLARLAPKDSKLRTIGKGLAAASRGDIQGTLGAIADLGGAESKVGRVAKRLEIAAGALELVSR